MKHALCVPKVLPLEVWIEAADTAVEINPANAPDLSSPAYLTSFHLDPPHIAALTSAYWGAAGANLGVRFLDRLSSAFKARVLAHMNRWGDFANVSFRESGSNATIRIATEPGQGHYSYLGTDNLHVPANRQTMNLDSFNDSTTEEEVARVVEHETGHALGFVHEHLRRGIVSGIDVTKCVAYFSRTQGWSRATTLAQVLTPVEEWALLSPPVTEEDSVMCYHLPGEIMKDGKDVLGGKAITASDGAYAGRIYPRKDLPSQDVRLVLRGDLAAGTYRVVKDAAASLNM